MNGWQVRRGVDPASVPVLLAGNRRVLLTAEGGYTTTVDCDTVGSDSSGVPTDP